VEGHTAPLAKAVGTKYVFGVGRDLSWRRIPFRRMIPLDSDFVLITFDFMLEFALGY
jgi:hypothetical protein